MDIAKLANTIIEKRRVVPDEKSLLVGISGIDGGGKGYVTRLIDEPLRAKGLNTAVVNIDGWLNLPHVRFDPDDLAGNFYRNGIRFDEMFDRLIIPLRDERSVDITADFAEETATEYREHRYAFHDLDIILLEGIFLFKREFVDHFDLRIWIECSFETALKRAVARSQEGLSSSDTIRAYETIYFPAQRIHFDLDDPRATADIRMNN